VSESELEMGYVGKHGVEALQRYKYSGVDKSYMAKYVFQPFWRYCVNFFPLWMPPNMITLMGFMFVLASALLSYIYSPRLDSPAPAWVYMCHGILLFLYQTFDAVDGKQARRTNSSSPLGELFDHGISKSFLLLLSTVHKAAVKLPFEIYSHVC
jgi:ethanolaminephosphotransferase